MLGRVCLSLLDGMLNGSVCSEFLNGDGMCCDEGMDEGRESREC